MICHDRTVENKIEYNKADPWINLDCGSENATIIVNILGTESLLINN